MRARALAFGPALLLCCLALVPSPAHAQLNTGERFDGEGHRVLFELGGAQRREGPFGVFAVPRDFDPPMGGTIALEPHSFSGATFGLYARARAVSNGDPRARIGEGGALTLDVELAWRGTATGDGVQRAGNPLISAALGWATSDVVVRVALGAGLPLTSAFVGEANEPRAYSLLRASQGHGDVWLATEESFPVVLRARVEGRAERLFAGGDFAGALMPMEPRYSRSTIWPSVDELIAVAQVGAWVGVRPIEQLAIGARGQLVVQYGGLEWPEVGYGYPSLSTTTPSGTFVRVRSPYFFPDQLEAFVSLIAFVRGEIDDLTLEGRLHLNLDAPDGVAFDQGATWAASLTAGWTP